MTNTCRSRANQLEILTICGSKSNNYSSKLFDFDARNKNNFYYVQIQTIDNQLPVILLAIRLRSLDLKHLIPGNGPPKIQG